MAHKNKHPEDVLNDLFWKCANSYSERQFIDNLELTDQYPDANKDLLLVDSHHWSKAFFNRDTKCDSNHNNIVEAFNGVDVMFFARQKPIYSFSKDIRRYLMARFYEKRLFGEK